MIFKIIALLNEQISQESNAQFLIRQRVEYLYEIKNDDKDWGMAEKARQFSLGELKKSCLTVTYIQTLLEELIQESKNIEKN